MIPFLSLQIIGVFYSVKKCYTSVGKAGVVQGWCRHGCTSKLRRHPQNPIQKCRSCLSACCYGFLCFSPYVSATVPCSPSYTRRNVQFLRDLSHASRNVTTPWFNPPRRVKRNIPSSSWHSTPLYWKESDPHVPWGGHWWRYFKVKIKSLFHIP